MMNITNNALTAAELQFIRDVAAVFAPVGMPDSVGRVYGYLLLKQKAVSLEQIGSDLSLSKGAAWNAARILERYGQADRYSEAGSKRAMYAPAANFDSSFLWQLSLLGKFGQVLQNGASSVATGERSARLAAHAQFYVRLRQWMETAMAELNTSCQANLSSPADSDPEAASIAGVG